MVLDNGHIVQRIFAVNQEVCHGPLHYASKHQPNKDIKGTGKTKASQVIDSSYPFDLYFTSASNLYVNRTVASSPR